MIDILYQFQFPNYGATYKKKLKSYSGEDLAPIACLFINLKYLILDLRPRRVIEY